MVEGAGFFFSIFAFFLWPRRPASFNPPRSFLRAEAFVFGSALVLADVFMEQAGSEAARLPKNFAMLVNLPGLIGPFSWAARFPLVRSFASMIFHLRTRNGPENVPLWLCSTAAMRVPLLLVPDTKASFTLQRGPTGAGTRELARQHGRLLCCSRGRCSKMRPLVLKRFYQTSTMRYCSEI